MKVELGKAVLWEKNVSAAHGFGFMRWKSHGDLFFYTRKIMQIHLAYTNTMLRLTLAIAHSTPPRSAVPTLLSLHDWEIDMTSEEAILSPSGKKKKEYLSSFASSASTREPTAVRGMHKPRFPRSEPACGKMLTGMWSCVRTWQDAAARASPLASSRTLWSTPPPGTWRQLSFRAGNGSVSFCRFAALQEKVASALFPERGIHMN